MRCRANLVLCLWLCTSLGAEAVSSVYGIWQGKIRIGDADYRMVIHVAKHADGSSAATLDSPDTGKLGIPVPSLKVEENTLAFELDNPKVSFLGTVSGDGTVLRGTWKQQDKTIPLSVERAAQLPEFANDGSYLFHSQCATCHTPFNSMRAPWPNTLRLMPQSAILAALETGKMSAVGSAMTREQRAAVASYLGRPQTAEQSGKANPCTRGSSIETTPVWNGWSVDLYNSRFQSAELAGLTKSQLPRFSVKWAFGYAGATSAGGPPTIMGERIFVAGGDGRIYSMDMHTGCVYWTFLPAAPARTAITVSADGRNAFFGDVQARAYALNTSNGALVWTTDLDSHPFAMITGAPKLYQGRLYVPVSSAEELAGANPKYPCCSFRGSVNALDAKSGALIWKTYTIPRAAQPTSVNGAGTYRLGPSGAGVWSSPTIDSDRNLLYIGTGDNYSDPGTTTSDAVLAINLDDGKIVWVKQLTAEDRFNLGCLSQDKSNCPNNPGTDYDIGAPPILRHLKSGKSMLVVGQKSGTAYGLDPDAKGAILWESHIGKGGSLGGIEFGGAASDTQAFFPLSDWAPDPKIGGGMFALDLANGNKIWSTAAPIPACINNPGCSRSQQAPATLMPGVVFSGSLDGHIRAYDELDGKLSCGTLTRFANSRL